MNISTAKWAAALAGVREVTLTGAANLDYWHERLEAERLRPVEANGRAQVLIIAAAAKFKGIRFRELSFSILAAPVHPSHGPAGAFLVQAFNTNRFFAFVERRVFATPYAHGSVSVDASLPASINLALAGPAVFHAEMFGGAAGAPPRTPLRSAEDGWEGAVYLPAARRRGQAGKLFFARVQGFTDTYEFLPEDWLSLTPDATILEQLLASQFAPTQWLVRASAVHAKSKTYVRDE